jgi:predicted nuclease of restriction endonuclease-like (RecB) superfamily
MKNNLNPQFTEIAQLIQEARQQTLKMVNKALIQLYWQVGEYISLKVQKAEWGESVVSQLATYLATQNPDLKGFTKRGLWRMKQFYEAYYQSEKLSPLVTQINWTNNLLILSQTKTIEEKEFYLRLCIKERYSKRELERQLKSAFYERVMLSKTQTSPIAKEIHPQIEQLFLDSYVVEFLNLPHQFSEFELQKAILQNLKKFVLEFGKDFLLVGEEYKVEVGKQDFYIDLLFYHRELSCLVAVELKIDDFKPEYLGKINFYLEALDRDVKKTHENPSVGIILCKSKDDEVVEYALSRNLSPALVAEYQTKLIDKKLLQQKLHELFKLSEERE